MSMTAFPFISKPVGNQLNEYGQRVGDRPIGVDYIRDTIRYNFGDYGIITKKMDELQVIAGAGMEITIKSGVCVINGVLCKQPEPSKLTLPQNSGAQNKIHSVVIKLNDNIDARDVEIYIKEGTELTRNATISEICLAEITVIPNNLNILQKDIRDTRTEKDKCGFVATAVDKLDFNPLFAQLSSQFNEWFETMTTVLDENTAKNLLDMITTKQNQTTARNQIVKADSSGVLVPAVADKDYISGSKNIITPNSTLPVGDFNDFKTPGAYFAPSGCKNAPSRYDGKLIVDQPTRSSVDYITQRFSQGYLGTAFDYNERGEFVREFSAGRWQEWRMVVYGSKDLKNGVVKCILDASGARITTAEKDYDYATISSGDWSPMVQMISGSTVYQLDSGSGSPDRRNGKWKKVGGAIHCAFDFSQYINPLNNSSYVLFVDLPFSSSYIQNVKISMVIGTTQPPDNFIGNIGGNGNRMMLDYDIGRRLTRNQVMASGAGTFRITANFTYF